MNLISEIFQQADEFLHTTPALPEIPVIPKGKEIAAYIDHTLLKPEATASQIKKLCQEALEHRFAAVCINPVFVPLAAEKLRNSHVAVCTVIGFPLGANTTELKALEALSCIKAGATEIDMVINIGALKSESYSQVLNDISAVQLVANRLGVIVKVILETALLDKREKVIACYMCKAAQVDYVKTSTGFASSGATVEDVNLMYNVVSPSIKVKAAGGIRNAMDALKMIHAGASRIGASAGVQILQEALQIEAGKA